LTLVPVTAAGVPVLASALVALAIGLATRLKQDPTEIPERDDLASGGEHP
jgi:hypothetical protein